MKTYITLTLLLLLAGTVSAQKYFTRNGFVRFFSAAPLENIEATTNQASCIVDLTTGEVVSKLLIESFQFEKALMQEHFNENYMESDKFPQALLKGSIANHKTIDFNNLTNREIEFIGEITIHGITQPLNVKVTIDKKEDLFTATSKFILKPADFEIKIPKAIANNIAKEIEVSLKFDMKPLNRQN